jgi:predicted nuclease of predicted toxin-antitoxin system
MKILIDMNLPPSWVEVFIAEGWEAAHWSQVGDLKAHDLEIMTWAKENGYIVFTHDLDFSALLAATHADGPSVIQVRTQNVMPDHLKALIVNSIRSFEKELEQGVLISIDEQSNRARILPFK